MSHREMPSWTGYSAVFRELPRFSGMARDRIKPCCPVCPQTCVGDVNLRPQSVVPSGKFRDYNSSVCPTELPTSCKAGDSSWGTRSAKRRNFFDDAIAADDIRSAKNAQTSLRALARGLVQPPIRSVKRSAFRLPTRAQLMTAIFDCIKIF